MTRKVFWRTRKKTPSARNLTSLALDDAMSILNSADIAKEWASYAPRLSELCQIQDGKTGGVNPGDRRALFYLVRAFRPARVLEIGTHVGASTVHLVAALMRSAWEQIPHLVTVDIEDVNDSSHSCWRQSGLEKSPKQMAEELNTTVEITFVTDDSRHFFATTNETFDFIFLDGDHAAETVYQDIVGSLDVIKKNGLIVLHDYFPGGPLWPEGPELGGPFTAAEKVRATGVAIKVIPLESLPWPTKLGSHVTSLALITR